MKKIKYATELLIVAIANAFLIIKEISALRIENKKDDMARLGKSKNVKKF